MFIKSKPSPFKMPRGNNPLDMIVIHHIGSKNGKIYSIGGTIRWFTDIEVHRNPDTGKIENKVSAHFAIPREPYEKADVIRFVDDKDIAYHAGRSKWTVNGKERTNINKYSIGIELQGDGNFVEYTDFQYDTLISLLKEIVERYDIPAENIVGHEHISPGRKVDPGKMFDWKRVKSAVYPPKQIVMDPVSVKGQKPIVEEDKSIQMMESGKDSFSLSEVILNLIRKILGK